MKVASFFAGCGGLDLGFRQAGFDVVWANELEPSVHETYMRNHPGTELCIRDLNDVTPDEIPDCDGFIGGPPCQPWSLAGKQGGLGDVRGKVFLKYIELIARKQPKFFLIENVKGLLDEAFADVFNDMLQQLEVAGYDVSYKLLNAINYRVPQNRERVFIIGFRKDLHVTYHFPAPTCEEPISLELAIGDIKDDPYSYTEEQLVISAVHRRMNHDVITGCFGDYYLKANRRRDWIQPSFTIHATALNEPLHPSSPKMKFVKTEQWAFRGDIKKYRRLSVRECARIQTFPDSFEFYYTNIKDGYRMVGNAVPPRMAFALAGSIRNSLLKPKKEPASVLVGYYKNAAHLANITGQSLYNVRSDGRRGSISRADISSLPQFLLLHNHGKKQFWKLSNEEPVIMTGEALNRLGYNVSGYSYLCFKLESKVKEESLEALTIKEPSYAPYFTTIEVIVKTMEIQQLNPIILCHAKS